MTTYDDLAHAITAEEAVITRVSNEYGFQDDALDLINTYRRAQTVLTDPNATTADLVWADSVAYSARSAHGTGETP